MSDNAIAPETTPETTPESTTETPSPNPQNSYVKLAMRNMVRKKGLSLYHFFLTLTGLIGFLVGVSYLTR